jgi:hypothetical protein
MRIEVEKDIFPDKTYKCFILLINKDDIKNLLMNKYIFVSDENGNEYWLTTDEKMSLRKERG